MGVPEKITEFKCPSCGGPLQFSASSGLLECAHCGAKYEPAEIDALYKEKTEGAEAAFAQDAAAQNADAADQTQWDYSDLSGDWGSDQGDMRAYICSSCGAELICDATTAATQCPYCGNNAIVPGQFSGALKPDMILPFKLDKAQAIQALKKHYRGKWLLPKAFSAANHIQKIQGVYVPFWLYNASADVECNFQGRNVHTRRRGDVIITDTDHYNIYRGGTVEFTNVPVDGSSKMDDRYMDSLEPFDYAQLTQFSTSYLPGYMADRYDQGASECADRADQRCKNSAVAAMRADVKGYSHVNLSGSRTAIGRGKVHYALLPVWVLHTRWQNKDYLFMMNGQTGKLVGDLPVDKRKFKIGMAIGAAVFALILYFANIAPYLGGIIAKWIMGMA